MDPKVTNLLFLKKNPKSQHALMLHDTTFNHTCQQLFNSFDTNVIFFKVSKSCAQILELSNLNARWQLLLINVCSVITIGRDKN